MAFGTCAIFDNNKLKPMTSSMVKIDGVQHSLLTNFEILQTFKHNETDAKEVKYLFPTDLKICLYDITFVVGTEIIKPQLKAKEEAQESYSQAVEEGRTAIYGSDAGNGLAEFKIGNIEPNVECKVILKIAFSAQLQQDKTFYIKFPLDVYTPSGSKQCIDISTEQFHFTLQGEKDKLCNITSNIKNGQTDLENMVFSINGKIQNQSNEKSIIITFTNKEPIESRCFTTTCGSYSGCSLIVAPQLPLAGTTSREFVFLVDCSGSMRGTSIRNASQCLQFFIKSLPVDTHFNVFCFGSNFESFFDSSQPYNEKYVQKAIKMASNLGANLGGTDIYRPLQHIFDTENRFGQRQVFILTDGEVRNPTEVIQLVSEHSHNNRCFTIGLGRGCDAGLVEGIANASGGKCDFVQEEDSISQKVIPQLRSSLQPSLSSLEIHIEGDDSFEVSPYPIPSVNPNGALPLFIRTKNDQSIFENGLLITGSFGQENIELPVQEIEPLSKVEEDMYGYSSGRNICSSILPLFSFYILQSLQRKRNITEAEKAKAIELSISSGVLSTYTAYVGMTDIRNPQNDIIRPHMHYAKHRNFACKMKKTMAPRSSQMMACPTVANDDVGRPIAPKMRCAKSAKGSRCAKMPPKKSQMMACPSVANDDVSYRTAPKTKCLKSVDEGGCCEGAKMKRVDNPVLENLMLVQNINGSWPSLHTIYQITGITLDHIDGVNISDPAQRDQCFATLIAIAALRTKAANERNTWMLIESKALSWLQQMLPNTDIEAILNHIISSI